jgi:hypothetical protein
MYIGDNDTDDEIDLFGPGAAAVIETGMATQTRDFRWVDLAERRHHLWKHSGEGWEFLAFRLSIPLILGCLFWQEEEHRFLEQTTIRGLLDYEEIFCKWWARSRRGKRLVRQECANGSVDRTAV